MNCSLSFNREIPLRKITWFQRKISIAQRPLPYIVETMVNMAPPWLAQCFPPALERLSDAPQAVQLVKHGNCEHAFFSTKANVVVSQRCGPQPLFISCGADDRIVHGLFDSHFSLPVLGRQVPRMVAAKERCRRRRQK
jgi:hypothetical protein